MNARIAEIIVNVLFWLASAWLIASGFSIQAQELENINGIESVRTIRSSSMIWQLMTGITLSVIMFYINLWNLQRLGQSRSVLQVVLTAIIILGACLGLYSLLNQYALAGSAMRLTPTLVIGIPVFYFTVSITYGLAKVWFRSQKRQQALILDKKRAELQLIRNQLQPHFLFNALNNLLSMVDQAHSPRLAESFERLSQLLRYVIENTDTGKTDIQSEITFIRNYAALQLLRFEEDEIDFQLDITGKHHTQSIEPGLLIPFVENAFKYGTEPEQKTFIHISIDLGKENEIAFLIKNKIVNSPHLLSGSGTGIRSAQERLTLAYPGRHELHITRNDIFVVMLKLKTR